MNGRRTPRGENTLGTVGTTKKKKKQEEEEEKKKKKKKKKKETKTKKEKKKNMGVIITAGFEILAKVETNMQVFCDVTKYLKFSIYCRFEAAYWHQLPVQQLK
jgi:ribosomal protein S25